MTTRALLIVDVQNDFLPGGALEVPEGDAVVPVINDLQDSFDVVAATQDWHPEGHRSFASRHEGKEPMDTGSVDGNEQVLWPDHCVRGTEGARLAPGLDTRPVEAIFRKGTNPRVDSYSGFFDMNHKVSTGLTGYLREKEVEEVVVCGLAADVCVKFTVLDAAEEGFRVKVVEDAVRGVNLEEGDVDRAFGEMREAGAEVVVAEDFLL